jgi:hypothetical protein
VPPWERGCKRLESLALRPSELPTTDREAGFDGGAPRLTGRSGGARRRRPVRSRGRSVAERWPFRFASAGQGGGRRESLENPASWLVVQDAFRVGPCRAPPVKAPGLRRRRQEARGKSAADASRSQQPLERFSCRVRKARHFPMLRPAYRLFQEGHKGGRPEMAPRKLARSKENREAPRNPPKPSGIDGGPVKILCPFTDLSRSFQVQTRLRLARPESGPGRLTLIAGVAFRPPVGH